MHTDDIRARFLSDRVVTATPAQRVVMLYDRLLLDLSRAATLIEEGQPAEAGPHLGHGMQIVVELQTSLDRAVGNVADNLHALYSYLISQLIAIRSGSRGLLPDVQRVVGQLRDSWASVAEGVTEPTGGALAGVTAHGAWVS